MTLMHELPQLDLEVIVRALRCYAAAAARLTPPDVDEVTRANALLLNLHHTALLGVCAAGHVGPMNAPICYSMHNTKFHVGLCGQPWTRAEPDVEAAYRLNGRKAAEDLVVRRRGTIQLVQLADSPLSHVEFIRSPQAPPPHDAATGDASGPTRGRPQWLVICSCGTEFYIYTLALPTDVEKP